MGIRGSGRTHKKIEQAPQGAIFIGHTHAFRNVFDEYCQKIGRKDLRYFSAESLGEEGERLAGLSDFIVVDHFARFNEAQWERIWQNNALWLAREGKMR